ncbi:SDR family oxidoreductase [Paracoccus caeni]|uniref:SDR family oxidoreductase n=1 Tax=Paracoccus caeni TaxID=657651 RepID=A0A934VWN2_9RHOB|nr:SDR family oxidoreductase [Paracoccus caeni]MBK4218236.1 SDR family oxidoreductase [Paracoccus caeni]
MMNRAAANREIALVTGSTSGIGAAIARRLVDEGLFVILHSGRSPDKGAALAAELGFASYIQADLSREAERVRLISDAVAVTGGLDVLVNNAGISGLIPHDDLSAASPDIWRAQYEVNVIAPFQLVALSEKHLRASAQRNGRASVINISSHAGVRPKGGSIPYAATKAALNHVTRLLARTLGPEIRVNAVAPGLVNTPLTADWTEAQEMWKDQSPMKRPAQPEDIAQAVMMLIRADYITGEILLSDGGLNLT